MQAAIDAAAAGGGGVVLVPERFYRIDGELQVSASGVVIRGEGPEATRLLFTRHEGMSDRSHLRIAGAPRYGADLPLAADGAPRATDRQVTDAAGPSSR